MCREGALQGPCNAKGPRGTSGQAGQPCVLEPQTAWVAETSHEDAEAEEAGMGLRRWDLTISVQVMQGAARGEGRPAGGVEEKRQHRTMASSVPVRGRPWLLPLDGFADERWGPWMETTWPRPFQQREPGCICFAGCRTNAPQANSWSHSSGGQKSKVKGWAELVPCQGSEGASSGPLPQLLVVCWQSHPLAHRSIPSISAFIFTWCSGCVFLSLQIPPFRKEATHI